MPRWETCHRPDVLRGPLHPEAGHDHQYPACTAHPSSLPASPTVDKLGEVAKTARPTRKVDTVGQQRLQIGPGSGSSCCEQWWKNCVAPVCPEKELYPSSLGYGPPNSDIVDSLASRKKCCKVRGAGTPRTPWQQPPASLTILEGGRQGTTWPSPSDSVHVYERVAINIGGPALYRLGSSTEVSELHVTGWTVFLFHKPLPEKSYTEQWKMSSWRKSHQTTKC